MDFKNFKNSISNNNLPQLILIAHFQFAESFLGV